MITDKYPEKAYRCEHFLKKKELTTLDIISLNIILCTRDSQQVNQKLKSYDRSAIFEILSYQKQHALTNMATARYFKISRTTLQKWKRIFIV